MIESDHSEADEENMDKLELSSDSIDSTTKKKRPRIEDSMDKLELSSDSIDSNIKRKKPKMKDMGEVKGLSSKKWQSLSEQTEILKENNETILDKNSIDEYNAKKEKHIIYSENGQNETFLCKSDMDIKEEKQLNKVVKQKNRNKSPLDEDSVEVKIDAKNVENEAKPLKELVENTTATSTFENKKIEKDATKKEDNATTIEEKEDKKNGLKKEYIIKSETTDTEVVDGLELSVECASDKEEPSSENEDDKDAKPRPKTIIIKAKPNESELECSSSEEEKYDSQEATDIPENKSQKKKKRRGSRTSSNTKVKDSKSEDSQNNNSDEDYGPRIKRKMKKSLATGKSTKYFVESRSRRDGNTKKISHKKGTQYASNDKNMDMTSVDKTDKLVKNETEEELSEKESSVDKSESNSNSENEETSTKGKRTRRSNTQKDNKQIQRLKRYLSIAGVRIKYNVFNDCKNNATRIRHLKELLEKNGVNGRPTLEKCKRAREENERMREVSELDVSNIISEGRVTRARRNMDNGRQATPLDTPPRHREARSTFKRIQTVIDSDSE